MALVLRQKAIRILAFGDYTKAIQLGLPTTHHTGLNPLALLPQPW